MILEDVQLKHDDSNDQNVPYYFKSRVMEVTTDKGKFLTPSRVISRTEHIARSEFGMSKALPKELAIDFRTLIDKQIQDFTSSSKAVKTLIQKTQQFNDITRKAVFRMSVFQPAGKILTEMHTQSKIKFADLQANFLQIKLGSNLITYPYLALPHSEYAQFIDSHHRRDERFSTIFVLDLEMDPRQLEKIVKHLAAKEEPMIIALIYRDWVNTSLQHDVITSFFNNEKLAFFACQVPREEPESHSSNLHSVACSGGFDLVTLEQKRGFGNNTKLDLTKIRFFSPKNLRIDNIENTLREPGRNIIEEFDFAPHNFNDIAYLKKVLDGYQGARIHPRKYQLLYYLARIHEAITSYQAFELTRKRIVEKEIAEYISETGLREVPMIRNRR